MSAHTKSKCGATVLYIILGFVGIFYYASSRLKLGGIIEIGSKNASKVQFAVGRKSIFIQGCKCWKSIPVIPKFQLQLGNEKLSSRCSEDTWLYGGEQKIIAYSLFGDDSKGIFVKGLKRNIALMRELYPGWLMRIYSNINLQNFTGICPILCNANDVMWCDVHRLPGVGDISSSFEMTWRFLPVGDPLVYVFLSRDLDSPLSSREREAVEEWLANSTKAIHVMRDHQWHDYPVLGGMWGARTNILEPNMASSISDFFLKQGRLVKSFKKGWDQDILRRAFYTDKNAGKVLAHDSVYCWRYSQTECRPFPTLLQGYNYVGKVFDFSPSSQL